MYGLAAIEQANGWAMAGAGACIVISGLAVLSFLISMLPRVTASFDKKKPSSGESGEASPTPSEKPVNEPFPEDVNEASARFIEETKDLGDEFTMIDLHKKSKALGIVDPHLTLRRFRDAGILVSLGDERFSWQPLSE